MTRALGIDLGTTFSAVAAVDADGTPQILRNREGENITASVVLSQGDQVLVGSTAKRSAAAMPDDSAAFVKRFMGDPHWQFVDTQGNEYRAEQVSAFILKHLVDDAELLQGERIEDVVITVPAYFDDARRKATQDAGEIAGLNVLRLINEPTAAAVAYGLQGLDSGTVLVYDLGGGTFDVTAMKVNGGEFEVIATDGDRNLGGFDFDNELMKHVANEVHQAGGPDLLDGGAMETDLREKCELAKRTLTGVGQASVFITAGGGSHRIQVTREQFETMTKHLLDRTEVTLEGVLDDAELQWSQVDRILLVGGSTRMPMITRMIERVSGKTPESRINPDEAVALGAATVADMAAAEGSGPTEKRGGGARAAAISIKDVTSQSLGVLAVAGGGNEGDPLRNYPVIPKNSKIPCKHENTFHTLSDDQRQWLFQVTEGDDPDPEYVTILLERPIELPTGLKRGSNLKVIMSYDIDGVVHVEIVDLTNNKSLGEIELDRPLNLDRSEVDQMRVAMGSVEVE